MQRPFAQDELGNFRKLLEEHRADRGRTYATNPYKGRPSTCFWADSVARPEFSKVTPTARLHPMVSAGTKVATAGSCFAQHIAKTMLREGLNYFVAEDGPADMTPSERDALGYGVFSARYGNIYTARQLLQLMQRCLGLFQSSHVGWKALRGEGWLDPYRPNIGETFSSLTAVEEDQVLHLASVRRMFETTDIFVFTMGLTECWVDLNDGTAFPVAPGVVAKGVDAGRIGFINFGYEETKRDMVEFLTHLRKINPSAQVILTVSPVPLIATWSENDVLTATTYSKSVLRAVAGSLEEAFEHVHYFPSYEIITGSFNKGAYFEDDLRSVKPEGVSHVMRVFLDTLLKSDDHTNKEIAPEQIDVEVEKSYSELRDIVCDEELIIRNLRDLKSSE